MKCFSIFLFLLFFFLEHDTSAQFADDFSDGDFTTSPAWAGDNTKFEIDPGFTLHLAAPSAADDAVLVTASQAINDATWEFYVKLGFNPSSANFTDIYLVADQQDLRGPVNGYFVRVGNTQDEISLYRRSGDLTQTTKIIDGADDRVNLSAPEAKIKVTRDASGNWQLYSDVGLSGSYTLEGETLDDTYFASQYFGILCNYTSSRSDKFYFDDFSVTGTAYVDNTKPIIDTLMVTGENSLAISFSEAVGQTTAETLTNYQLSASNQNPDTASLVADTAVALTFPQSFPADDSLILKIKNIEDLAGNALDAVSLDFIYQPPYHSAFRDVVINEIMADPNPPVDLPDVEYVELFNATNQTIDLEKWQLMGAGNNVITNLQLSPGEFAILTGSSDTGMFSDKVVSWGSGSLLNGGEPLVLEDSTGQTIDSVFYQSEWYNDPDKMDGGWSLEQINPYTDCSDFNNWIASANIQGGTPGIQNSVFSDTPDTTAPQITSVFAIDPDTILITLDEWLAQYAAQTAAFAIDSNNPMQKVILSPTLTSLKLIPQMPLAPETYHQLDIDNLADCEGNSLDTAISFYFDNKAPEIDSVLTLTDQRLKIFLSEPVNVDVSKENGHFKLNGTSTPENVKWLNDTTFYLTFTNSLQHDSNESLFYSGLTDTLGNVQSGKGFDFIFQLPKQPGFNQLLITEIMADPSPPSQLPESEYLELYNPTDRDFILTNAVMQIGRDSLQIEELYFPAGKYLTLCPKSSENLFANYGNAMGLGNWPALNNSGDTLVIRNNSGEIVFSMVYTNEWILNEAKADGGWSLEMIDTHYPCTSNNWAVSIDESGGTPGRKNSVKSDKPDLTGPSITQAFPPSDSVVVVTMNEKCDPKTLFPENIAVAPALAIHSTDPIVPLLKSFSISLDEKITPKTQYTVTINNLTDCAGNLTTNPGNKKDFVLPEIADSLDIVLNEILFDPRPGGVDFVEVYNRSDKYINLKDWQIAVEKGDDTTDAGLISSTNFVLDPGQYLALTSDPDILKADYPMGARENFRQVKDMPNLLNDRGIVTLLNPASVVIDQFEYSVDYHSRLLANTEGVSLERINPDGPTDNPENWHSAAGTVGYATPGKKNSQLLEATGANDHIIIDPKVFAPGNSGPQDFTTINLHFNKTGNTASIDILDIHGRKIKTVADNESLAMEDSFHWDGDDDSGQMVRVGYYIVLIEITNPDGTTKTYKKKIVVGARF